MLLGYHMFYSSIDVLEEFGRIGFVEGRFRC